MEICNWKVKSHISFQKAARFYSNYTISSCNHKLNDSFIRIEIIGSTDCGLSIQVNNLWVANRIWFDSNIFVFFILNQNLNRCWDLILDTDNHPIRLVSIWQCTLLNLESCLCWRICWVSKCIIFLKFNQWPETIHSLIQWSCSIPLPFSPCVNC